MRRRIRIFITLLFLAFFSGAQEPVSRNYSTKNGLPGNEAHFLYSDSKGYMWICTDAGIAKYNANTFKVFDSSNGLPDNTIFEVTEDTEGRIWFRSYSGRVGFIENDSVHTIKANEVIRGMVREGILSSIYVDENGTLWLGKQSIETNFFIRVEPPYGPENVKQVWKQEHKKFGMEMLMLPGNKAIFTDSREVEGPLDFYSIKIYDKDHRLLLEDSLPALETSPQVHKFREGSRLYLTTGKVLKIYDLEKKTVFTSRQNQQLLPVFKHGNRLILGTTRNGLHYYKLTGPAPEFLYSVLASEFITCIARDFEGGWWFSTLESGVFYLGDEKITRYTLPENTKVTYLANLDGKTLLAATVNGSLYKIESGKFSNAVEKFYEDKEGLLKQSYTSLNIGRRTLISGSGGSLAFDFKTGNKKVVFNNGEVGYVFKKMLRWGNTIYASIVKSVYTSDTTFHSPELLFDIDDRITSMAIDSLSGDLYVSGLKGLYCYRNGKLQKLAWLQDTRIEDLAVSKGVIYAASKSAGFFIIDGEKTDTINTEDGLLSNFCTSVVLRDGIVWLTTNKGITRIGYNGNKRVGLHNYPLSHFGEPVKAEDICFSDGKIFFHSGSAIYSFSDEESSDEERLHIRSLEANGSALAGFTGSEFSYRTPNIKCVYEALFYKCSKILYRYNIGNGWNYTNETSVVFPSLSPGTYTLHIEALNANRKWIKADHDISFRIEKPFWTRAWFIVLEIALATTLLSAFIYLRYRHILKKENLKNKIQAQLFEFETRAIRAQMNPHFIFNALNTIQRFILQDDPDNAQLYLTRFSRLIRRMLESNDSDAIRLDEEIGILEDYLDIEKLRFDHSFNYIIHRDSNLPHNVKVPFMLVQPFVENAIWHGLLPKKGERQLEIRFTELDDKTILCIVDDNGVGRGFKSFHKQMGKERSLAIDFIIQRLDLLGKVKDVNCGVKIIDKTGEGNMSLGTRVEIIIPKLN